MKGSFKKENNLSKRTELSNRLLSQHPTRIPIIVELEKNTNIKLNRRKFLVPSEITMGAFLNEIRKQSSLQPHEALFIFCNENSLVPTQSLINQIYEKHKDMDGFLYITVALENTFGAMYYIDLITDSFLNKISQIFKSAF
jgi:GABA(A) receptor-associated protein